MIFNFYAGFMQQLRSISFSHTTKCHL